MGTLFGTLSPSLARESPELIAPRVLEFLRALPEAEVEHVLVSEIDPELSDTAAFCEAYQFPLSRAANCIVLEAKRGDRSWFAACVVLATTRADINGVVRKTLDARKVSFAPMEKAVSETGMEFGAITPIGLPKHWSILVDRKVTEAEYVTIGSGMRKSKLFIPGSFFTHVPHIHIVEGLGKTTNPEASA